MIALVVIIQLASFTAVYVATRNNVVNRARAELSVGDRVLERFLAQRSAQLSDTVDVLSEDFGFKQAVASGDRGTIRSVLLNHGARVNASLAMLIEPDGSVMASTLDTPVPGNRFPFPHLFAQVVNQGSTSAIVQFRGHIYQLVIVPVYAPLPIGWVCMGFVMDDQLARDLKGLTSLDVSFVSRNEDGADITVFSSLTAHEQTALKTRFDQVVTSKAGAVVPVTLADEEFLTLTRPLTDNPDFAVTAVLQNSLQTALHPYWRLLEQLVTFTLSALLVAFILAFLISRSLGRPLAILAAAARRIGGGDYAEPVHVDAKDEMAELATALNNMQEGIAEREERIAFQAYHDALTGLLNRTSIHQELRAAIGHANRKQNTFAVLMLDINRFKEINDSLGHHTGDQVLMELAQRLRHIMPGTGQVARLGGDEFLILLPNADAKAAAEIAAQIIAEIKPTINIADMQIFLDLSIGIALYPEHGDAPEKLLRRADIAMYDAKEQHIPWCIYEAGRDERYLKRLELIGDLKRAIEHEELLVYYQPKANVQDRTVESLEALVRWQHPRLGFLSPDEFIPLAEQSGNIHALTEWVLRRVIAQCRAWTDTGWSPAVSINLSALDLLNSHLPEHLSEWLEASGVSPAQVVLEITESAVMRDATYATQILNRLKACGVKLSIDDFGTGYSSLAQLKRLPVDELKIDKSFLMQLREDNDDAVIVRSTIELAHNMGLKVVAEGVETDECMRFLHLNKCDLAQGYFISRPMTAEALPGWLSEYRKT